MNKLILLTLLFFIISTQANAISCTSGKIKKDDTYTILRSYTVNHLVSQVNKLTKQGWKPQGGAAVGENHCAIQVMVKNNES